MTAGTERHLLNLLTKTEGEGRKGMPMEDSP